MNYEKLTVDRFEQNLGEGKYETLTGSRRAIGKTGWSEKEKEKARAIADKHFGGSDGAAKPAKKAAAKKVAKKAAKKMHHATAKKLARAKAASAASHVADETHPVKEAAAPKFKLPPTPTVKEPSGTSEALNLGRQLISFVDDVHAQIQKIKSVDPQANLSVADKELTNVLNKATILVSKSLGDVDDGDKPQARVALPKSAVPEVRRTIQQMAPTAPSAEVRPVATSSQSNITPEEQDVADALRSAKPASTIASLPRPATVPNG